MEVTQENTLKTKVSKKLSARRLREIAWDIGTKPLPKSSGDLVNLTMIHPHAGFLWWQVQEKSIHSLWQIYQERFNGSRFIIRVYDATCIVFDGKNANNFFDVDIDGLSGKRYIHINGLNRSYIAQMGFRLSDGHFHSLAGSRSCYFGSDRPSGNHHGVYLYVGSSPQRAIPIENISDIGFYERIHHVFQKLDTPGPFSLIHLDGVSYHSQDEIVSSFLKEFSQKMNELGFSTDKFLYHNGAPEKRKKISRSHKVRLKIEKAYVQLIDRYKKNPFSIIHCHDWIGTAVGLCAKEQLRLPFIVSFHSLATTNGKQHDNDEIFFFRRFIEKTAARRANLVIVPHQRLRDSLMRAYGIGQERIMVIPTPTFKESGDSMSGVADAKKQLGFSQDTVLGLFAGELCHANGVDLLIDALGEIFHRYHRFHFLFAGEGPLRGELERRIHQRGWGDRCHFSGSLDSDRFKTILYACDFVAFPARQWRGDEVVKAAISCGKPVLTTHQADISLIRHGQNGLLAYDHIGSIIWGLHEMLSSSVHGVFMQSVHCSSTTMTSMVVEHLIQYRDVLEKLKGIANG